MSKMKPSYLLFHIKALWQAQLTLPVFLLSLVSMGVTALRKDRRGILLALWIASNYLLITYLDFQAPRYSLYWIPVFCLFAAVTVTFFERRSWRVFATSVLLVIAGYQFATAYQSVPEFVDGYEEAARYVVKNKKGATILYSGVHDTGYFIFFVRKHDPGQEFIVLRANKILATSSMRSIVEEKLGRPDEIYSILNDFGVGYVVIEDADTGSKSLEWLRQEVKSDRFVLRKKIMIRSNYRKVNQVPLAIYEYRDAGPPKEGAKLEMSIPLMGDMIQVPLSKLMRKD